MAEVHHLSGLIVKAMTAFLTASIPSPYKTQLSWRSKIWGEENEVAIWRKILQEWPKEKPYQREGHEEILERLPKYG